jgi:hypothetical protein
VGAREEHAVNLVAIWSIKEHMSAFKSFLQHCLGLIISTKDDVSAVKAAAFALARANELSELVVELSELFNLLQVLFALRNVRSYLPLKESPDRLAFSLFVCLDVHFVVVRPKRVGLAAWKPNVLESQLDFDFVQSFSDFTQSLSDTDEESALLSTLHDLLVDAGVYVDELNVCCNSQINLASI